MKSRTFVLLFIFGLFLLLLPNLAEAGICHQTCWVLYGYHPGKPYCQYENSGIWSGVDRIGLIGSVGMGTDSDYNPTEVCTESEFNMSCSENSFWPWDADYNYFAYDGENCTAVDYYLSGLSCKFWTSSGGKWDKSDSKCVLCSGKKEVNVLGNTSAIYAYNEDHDGISGDGKCESACGASSQCDEKTYGANILVSGGICDYCVFTLIPSCSGACENDGYYGGTCTSAGCPYPSSSGNDCFYGCNVKTGTTCKYTCYCFDRDTPEPSCNHYSSGSTCYYDGTPDCYNSGWDCVYYDCYMDECCDCTSSGCDPNDDNCPNSFICDSGCDCQGPDLYIVDIEPFSAADKKVHYEIKNKGDADADSSKSSLYVDGSYKTYDSVSSISAGSSRNEYFSDWTCTAGIEYSIEVCADKDDDVDEEDEDNNCRTKTLTCPEEECDCTGWTSQSCGYSSCPWYQKGRTRTCTPDGCAVDFECYCDESCCTDWANQGCGPLGGCADTEMYQTRDCGTCSYSTSRCVSDPSCGGVVTINPPVVITIASPTVEEDPAHPGKYRAILTGYLDSLGYDPGTCPNCKCIIWFEWGTSGSYGNSNTPIEMTTEDDYFYFTADNLDSSTTYYFEAFAKNGGSW